MRCLLVRLVYCKKERRIWREKDEHVYKYVCGRWRETARLEMADVLYAVFDVCTVSGWVAGELFVGKAGVL